MSRFFSVPLFQRFVVALPTSINTCFILLRFVATIKAVCGISAFVLRDKIEKEKSREL